MKKARVYAALGAVGVVLAVSSVLFLQLGQPSLPPQGANTSSTTGQRYADAVVSIIGASDDAQYNPQSITVMIGINNTVIWVNSGSIAHTVTSTTRTSSGAPLFDSGNMAAGAEFSYTFAHPGTYGYYCAYHGTMVGQVTVLAQSP